MAPPKPERTHVFISYSHQDKRFLDRLLVHLKPLIRDDDIAVWSDRQIRPGKEWQKEIKAAIAAAKVAVLMVTPDFLASDFIHKNELPPLLAAAKKKGVTLLWVPVKDTRYRKHDFSAYQATHDPGKPLDKLRGAERTEAFNHICEMIEDAMKNP